ncbi:MAG: protease modulator HflC [Gammaproteobacteria bacterium]|nr:protease modulator HflC [Gammaproteobacteria bacterium]
MKINTGVLVVILLAVTWVLNQAVYIVDERERAVMLRFGELVRADIPPGIHIKTPIAFQIKKFDGRTQTLDSPEAEYLTSEKKQLIVDSYVKWRIADVSKFYRATGGDPTRIDGLLLRRVDNGLRNQFGERTVREVVSGERDQLMADMTGILDVDTREQLGVTIIDVRVMKINLPDNVSDSVYQRMRTERERLAQELRSQGREEAEGIQANADRERTIIIANAYKDSEILRGEGDAEAANTYAKSYGRSPDFYDFYRSLVAYREVFQGSNNFLVLKPDSEFLKYIQSIDKK